VSALRKRAVAGQGPTSRRRGRRPPAGNRATEGDGYIARPTGPITPTRDGPRVNEFINVPNVRLIGADGEQVGVVPTRQAIQNAQELGLDLVEVSPNADPPVCKILDYGKLKYEQQKKKNEARKKQKTIEVKEIKMRPNIDTHDYDVKMRSIHRFLDEGDKVKVTLRFRGRELAHTDIAVKVLERVQTDLQEIAKVEQFPKLEGRQMTMVVSPR
jgi:translation initiation factor IF-3